MNKQITKQSSAPVAIGSGVLAGMLLTVTGAAILAMLIDRELIAEKWMGHGVGVIVFAAATVSAWGTIVKFRKNMLPMALGSSVFYAMVLLAINALFFSGQYVDVLPQVLLIIGTGGCTGMLSIMRNNPGKQKRI